VDLEGSPIEAPQSRNWIAHAFFKVLDHNVIRFKR
jgi:hypothetical protein